MDEESLKKNQNFKNIAYSLYDIVINNRKQYLKYVIYQISKINWDDELRFEKKYFGDMNTYSFFNGMDSMKNQVIEILQDASEYGFDDDWEYSL